MKPERRAQEDGDVTEEEHHLLRGLIGCLQYAAGHTRPDLTSALSQLQSQISNAKVSTLVMANKTFHNAKKHNDVTIKINPIAPKDFRRIICIQGEAQILCRNDDRGHSQRYRAEQVMYHRSTLLGNQKDPKGCDKYAAG